MKRYNLKNGQMVGNNRGEYALVSDMLKDVAKKRKLIFKKTKFSYHEPAENCELAKEMYELCDGIVENKQLEFIKRLGFNVEIIE